MQCNIRFLQAGIYLCNRVGSACWCLYIMWCIVVGKVREGGTTKRDNVCRYVDGKRMQQYTLWKKQVNSVNIYYIL